MIFKGSLSDLEFFASDPEFRWICECDDLTVNSDVFHDSSKLPTLDEKLLSARMEKANGDFKMEMIMINLNTSLIFGHLY